ncbi:MAG: hypothetical protein R2836_01775 [Chitinophagales bacterium]|nr:hypothetical protein [Bacteroidota bacterium]MCB9225895.1 hypothetical protein [Chitinophagales bacterium]
MKIPAIKKLVEANHSFEELEAAEEAIINEQKPTIEIEGADDGEQLTHVMAAKWIKQEMGNTQCDFKTALRKYTEKVRGSIS